MAALKGTEKQVAWAEDLKAARLVEVNEWLDGAAAEAGVGDEEREAMRDRILEVFEGQTSASWWIDRRKHNIDHFVEVLLRDARFGVGRDGRFEHGITY